MGWRGVWRLEGSWRLKVTVGTRPAQGGGPGVSEDIWRKNGWDWMKTRCGSWGRPQQPCVWVGTAWPPISWPPDPAGPAWGRPRHPEEGGSGEPVCMATFQEWLMVLCRCTVEKPGFRWSWSYRIGAGCMALRVEG